MKLYYSKGACSLVVRIILNEIGVNAQYESVDLQTKKTETGDDFKSINPKGAVPSLQLDNGEILTENAVILQYLADKNHATTLLPAVGDFKRYRTLEWLNYITTELHKSFALVFNPIFSKDDVILIIEAKFKFLDKALQHDYLLGDEFTLPDAYLYVMLRWASAFKVNLTGCTKLHQYYALLERRESIKRSLADEALG